MRRRRRLKKTKKYSLADRKNIRRKSEAEKEVKRTSGMSREMKKNGAVKWITKWRKLKGLRDLGDGSMIPDWAWNFINVDLLVSFTGFLINVDNSQKYH